MESMRATWTDERLDDGFERVDKDLREVRGEMTREFSSLRAEMNHEFNSLREELNHSFGTLRGETNQGLGSLREDMHAEGLAIRGDINARFDSLQRTMIQFGGSLIVAFVGLIIAVVLRGG